MDCNFDEKLLHQYIDDELEAGQKAAIESHLGLCAICQNRIAELKGLKDILATACLEQKAPLVLRYRILDSLEQESIARDKKPGIFERLRNFNFLFRPARIAVPALAGLVIVALVWLNWSYRQPRITIELVTNEHLADAGMITANKNGKEEIAAIIKTLINNSNQSLDIPDCLAPGTNIANGHLTQIGDANAAHILYANDSTHCSLFIFPTGVLTTRDPQHVLISSGTEYQCGRNNGLNYVLWGKNGRTYIITSCCSHEKLLNMARSAI
jgi:anti-sigma factor RsiW